MNTDLPAWRGSLSTPIFLGVPVVLEQAGEEAVLLDHAADQFAALEKRLDPTHVSPAAEPHEFTGYPGDTSRGGEGGTPFNLVLLGGRDGRLGAVNVGHEEAHDYRQDCGAVDYAGDEAPVLEEDDQVVSTRLISSSSGYGWGYCSGGWVVMVFLGSELI